VCSVFPRRRQLSIRSQTTDRLLQKLNDDSRPQSVVIYDHLTLCQRHRQQHLHQHQQQQHPASSLSAFPLLLQPREHLAANTGPPTSSAQRTADILLVPRALHCGAPGVTGNHVTSSMTSFALECHDCGDANAGDACLDEDTHATEM